MRNETIAGAFENLGDNCEFGFVQRQMGVEQGGLLRWSITRPSTLAQAIANKFDGIYDFDNLSPSSPKMVLDRGSEIGFHTAMLSENGKFLLDEEARKTIWREEIKKIKYLSEKMNKILECGSKILVYKKNAGVSQGDLKALSAAIASRGPCKLLYVESGSLEEAGTVTHISGNAYLGKIDCFAPYNDASNCSYDVWLVLLKNMLNMALADK